MTDDPGAELARYGRELADALEAVLPGWVRACVGRVLAEQGMELTDELDAAAVAAGDRAVADVGPAVRRLLDADIDAQRTTPLALVRTAVAYPTAVLRGAGAVPVARDRYAAEAFPADAYDLTPASFADLDTGGTGLAEAGLAWGAAKAFVHRRRHRGSAGGR